MKIGQKFPKFSVKTTNDLTIKSTDLQGHNTIIYFYPKDNTPGCTQEGQDFRDNFAKFQRLNTIIFGVSRDSLASHEKFKTKFEFPFELISDEDEKLCQLFDVIKMKNMYGKQVQGIERSTFLFNDKGFLHQEWRKVKVKEHISEVLDAVKTLNKLKPKHQD